MKKNWEASINMPDWTNRELQLLPLLDCRRFRQLVDLFIEDYCDPRTQRGEKTMLVRNVVETVHDNGYRFLKPDNEGVFAELGMKFVLKKVGQPLRVYSFASYFAGRRTSSAA
jgi:hypothetical protein